MNSISILILLLNISLVFNFTLKQRRSDESNNFYSKSIAKSAVDCFEQCRQDVDCYAINFNQFLANENCFLFTNEHIVSPWCIDQPQLKDDTIIKLGGYDVLLQSETSREVLNIESDIDCLNECLKDDNCAAISFTYDSVDICRLFSSDYTISYQENWITRYRTDKTENLKGKRLNGESGSFETISEYGCLEACKKDNSKCRAISFNKNANPSCYLYNSLGDLNGLNDDPEWTTLIRQTPNAEYRTNLRLDKHYKKINNILTVAQCFDICLTDDNCAAITYPPGAEYACFLYKADHGASRIFNGWRSVMKVPAGSILQNNVKIGHHYEQVADCTNCDVGLKGNANYASCFNTRAGKGSSCKTACYYFTMDESVRNAHDWVAIYKQ